MKSATSAAFKCFKCFVYFYLYLNLVLGIFLSCYASYLLLFQEESHFSKTRSIVLYFLIFPIIFSILAVAVGWFAIVKKKIVFCLKFFAILFGIAATVEVAGALWCFISLSEVKRDVEFHAEHTFKEVLLNSEVVSWWNDIQKNLKCCGLHGPSDYKTTKSMPFSCCGSEPNDHTKGFCSVVYQKGCSSSLVGEIYDDLICISLISIGLAVVQIPGIFLYWCFARTVSKEGL